MCVWEELPHNSVGEGTSVTCMRYHPSIILNIVSSQMFFLQDQWFLSLQGGLKFSKLQCHIQCLPISFFFVARTFATPGGWNGHHAVDDLVVKSKVLQIRCFTSYFLESLGTLRQNQKCTHNSWQNKWAKICIKPVKVIEKIFGMMPN